MTAGQTPHHTHIMQNAIIKTVFAPKFLYETLSFAKTGSGQT
jgi:hypothetical protein